MLSTVRCWRRHGKWCPHIGNDHSRALGYAKNVAWWAVTAVGILTVAVIAVYGGGMLSGGGTCNTLEECQ